MDNFASLLLEWFEKFGRKNLPWQQLISPYRVWVSEIMLQQTQVATVIPYFEKFIQRFPSIEELASAELDEVLHLWAGLGYYARARNLHKAARILIENFNGNFPKDIADIISLPGIGRSTAGAISSIAFRQRAAILDGNVKRVLTRLHAIPGPPNDKNIENKLWDIASRYTPQEKCAEYTQAIMDLGATLCTRANPNCPACPFKEICQAHLQNRVNEFPQTRSKKALPIKSANLLIFQNEKGELLFEKRPLMGIWGGLWSFPEYSDDSLEEYCQDKFGFVINGQQAGTPLTHTFSHFHFEMYPIYIQVEKNRNRVMEGDYLWCLPAALPKIGLAAPIKKLLQRVSPLNKE